MSDAAVRRLAAMLTEAQRAQIVQLAQVITAPATTAGASQAQTPGRRTPEFSSERTASVPLYTLR